MYLPAYIIILDDDLIEYMQYKRMAVASLYGTWLEYLAATLNSMLCTKRKGLPEKALPTDKTQIYWIEAANHKNFSSENVQAREIFNNCLDMVIKTYDNMRLLRIKELWSCEDEDLVMNNRFTKCGLAVFWRVVDSSFKFNVLKCKDFLIRSKFRQLKNKTGTMLQKNMLDSGKNQNQEEPGSCYTEDIGDIFDEVRNFFIKHQQRRHERGNDKRRFNRFLLPKPKPY